MLLRGVNHLFLRSILHGYVSHNQMIFIHIHPYFNLEDSAYLAALIDISLLFAEVFGHLERVRPKKIL